MRAGASRQGSSSAKRLEMAWESPKVNLYDHVDGNDFFSFLPADYRESGKPVLVYLTSDEPDAAERLAQLDGAVFGDENVAIGARLFRSVRMKGDRISKDHPHWATLGGRDLPRAIVVDATGHKVGELEGKELSASNLFRTMKKAASKTYRADLDRVVKETRDLLDEMDRVEAKQQRVAEQKKAASGAKLEALEAEEAELSKQLVEIRERDVALLKKQSDDRKVTKA